MMDKRTHYYMAFKQGGLAPEDAEGYIDALSDEILDEMTRMGFDRRLIKPIVETAAREKKSDNLANAVNEILGNKKRMLTFMQRYCM